MNGRSGISQVLLFCAAAASFMLFVMPLLLAPHGTTADMNDVRRTCATVFGGSFAIGAAWFAWLQLEVARDKAITERFAKATENLGSLNLHVRLGAIYALERIAHESRRDHWPIMEVLTAFVRSSGSEPHEEVLWSEDERIRCGEEEGPPKLNPDVQAALDVIGRREIGHETVERLDLTDAYLPAVKLRGNFTRANLTGANVRYGNCDGVNFSDADLSRFSGTMASFASCNFTNANLRHAACVFRRIRTANPL